MSMPLLIHAFSAGLVAPPAGTLIVGGGPAGLATAIALAKRGYKKVEVLDRLPPPPAVDDTAWSDTARFYLIGIGGRGQNALRKIGAWDAIEPFTQPVAGRKDWAPGSGVDGGVLTVRADRPPSNVIQRDRLVSCLLAESRSLGITVRHEVDVASVRWEGGEAVLTCRPCGEEACQLEEAVEGRAAAAAPPASGGEYELRAPFLVASDGVRRTVAAAVEAADRERRWALPGRRFKVTRFEDTSVRVYKTVPFRPPEDWRGDINYSARTAKANFDALPAPGGDYCGVLLIEPEDELTQGLPDVPSARRYFDDLLPMFSPHISDESLQAVIDKPTSRLPQFRYAGPRLHHRNTALLGDAVHSVKPYFGLGVNAAFEDVAALGQALDDSPDLPNALRAFSAKRAGEARVLVQLSRSFDLGGWRSFAFFIGPLILDGIFHGVAPSLFAPNTLAMLQKPHLSFARVRWRKRLDRTIQLAVLAAAATAAGRLAAVALGAAVRALTRASLPPAARPLLAAAPLAAAAAFALRLRQRVGGDVADVLASQVTTGSEKGERDEERLAGTRPGY